MSFADNLVYLRQHYGVTQEGLAEQLGVSRQTVSKWEAGTNYPEMDKLLALCDLFHTNLDDLMRGSVHVANKGDTERYDHHMNRHSLSMVAGVAFILAGVGVQSVIEAVDVFGDNFQAAVFLAFVVVGVMVLIMGALNHGEFKRRNPSIEPRYPADVLDRFGRRFPLMIAGGVGLILLAVIFLVGASPDDAYALVGGVHLEELLLLPFMLTIALGVGLIMWACLQKSKYDLSELTYIGHRRELGADLPCRTHHGRGLRRYHAAGLDRVPGVGLRAAVQPDRRLGRHRQVRAEGGHTLGPGRVRGQLDRVRRGRYPVRHRVPGGQRGLQVAGRLDSRGQAGGRLAEVRAERCQGRPLGPRPRAAGKQSRPAGLEVVAADACAGSCGFGARSALLS